MIELARVEDDPFNPFQYTPLLVLYEDGRLVQRRCEGASCNYHQTMLVEEELCRLVNAIDRTGFLSAPKNAYSMPETTGAVVRLSVHLHVDKTLAAPDLPDLHLVLQPADGRDPHAHADHRPHPDGHPDTDPVNGILHPIPSLILWILL